MAGFTESATVPQAGAVHKVQGVSRSKVWQKVRGTGVRRTSCWAISLHTAEAKVEVHAISQTQLSEDRTRALHLLEYETQHTQTSQFPDESPAGKALRNGGQSAYSLCYGTVLSVA